MARIDRYLLHQLLPLFAVALVAFLLLGLSSQWLRLLTRPDLPAIPFDALLQWMIFVTPPLAALLIPAAFLTAALAVVHRLAAEGELIAFAAAGLSPWRLTRPLLLAAAVATLLSDIAGAYGEPWGRRQARSLLADQQGNALSSALPPGSFRSVLPGVALRRDAPPSSSLMLADDRDPRRRYTAFARTGQISYLRENRTLRLELLDGQLLRASPGGGYQRTRFGALELALPLPDLGGRTELADYYPHELQARIDRLRREGRPTAHEELALAKKRAYPAACLAFALLALPLGATGSRPTRARAYLLAAGLLTGYYLLIRVVDAWAPASPLPPSVGVWLPNLLLGLLGAAGLVVRTRRV